MFKRKKTFAKRLTRWIILMLLILMSATMFFIYYVAKDVMTDENEHHYKTVLENTNNMVSHILSEVSVAVNNNEHEIKTALGQPNEMFNIAQRIVEKNERIRSCGISFIANYYPRKGRWFIPFAFKNEDGIVEKKVMGGKDYDYLNAAWFKEALEAKEGFWSRPFFEHSGDKAPLVSYLFPVRDSKGRVVAVVGADLSLDWLTETLKEQDKKDNATSWALEQTKEYSSYSFIIDQDGTYIVHPDSKRILNENVDNYLATTEDTLVHKVIAKMKKGEKSFMEEDVNIDNIPSFIFYAPMKGVRWSMGIIVPSITVRTGGIMLGIMLLIVMGIMLLIIFVFCRITIRRATKPLVRLASSADEMASGNFNAELPTIKYKDEIWQLRNSFAGMQQSLSQYMEKLKETTAAKATIENELKIAHNLQMAMLPKTFPPFPHRKDIDIYGSLSPAKEVGGDLFDYFIKDEKLYFCVGDVSGKGIPAALVMTVTRALFHTIASHAPNPSIIVQELSKMLTKGNDIMMFVTFFMGELDLKTGRLRYCNAGHDAPYLIGKEVTTLPCDSNIPLGVMDNWEYTIQETTIEKNTIIFLYTDGLNEAEAVNQELFGKENIMQALNQYLQLEEKNPRSLIESTRAAVREFVGEAEQSDDMTMLAIQYKCD